MRTCVRVKKRNIHYYYYFFGLARTFSFTFPSLASCYMELLYGCYMVVLCMVHGGVTWHFPLLFRVWRVVIWSCYMELSLGGPRRASEAPGRPPPSPQVQCWVPGGRARASPLRLPLSISPGGGACYHFSTLKLGVRGAGPLCDIEQVRCGELKCILN